MAEKKISVDCNWFYIEPNKPIISEDKVREFQLAPHDRVIAFQDDDQWEGVVSYNEEAETWYIELMEETYRDLSFPPEKLPAFSKMSNEEADYHFKWFKEELENRIIIFKNTYQAFTGNNKEELNFTGDSLTILGKWIRELTVEILGEDSRIIVSDYEPTYSINNAVDWFQQVVGKQIGNVNPGYIELILDSALYYSKVLQKKYGAEWTLSEKRIPVLELKTNSDFRIQINPFQLMLNMFQMGRRYRYQFKYIHKRIMRELRYRIRSLAVSKTRRNRQVVTLEVLSGVKEVENN